MSQLHGGCIETTCTHPPSGSKVGSRKQNHYTTSNLRDGDYVEDHKHYTTKPMKGSCHINKSFDILHKFVNKLLKVVWSML